MIEDNLRRLLQAAYKPESAPPGFKEDNIKSLLQDCPLGLEVCYGSCYWWMDGECTFLLEGLNGLSQNGDAQ